MPSREKGETMLAVKDFSGLAISVWARASAAPRVAMLLLDCKIALQIKQVETDGAGFRALGPNPVP